jgi:hypothetical protein
MWNLPYPPRTPPPAPREPAPPPPPEDQDTYAARVFGWFALSLGALAWFLTGAPNPAGLVGSRAGYEGIVDELGVFAFFGILAAIGVGLSIGAIRLRRRYAVAWVALLANAVFVARMIVGLVISRTAQWP